jgi:hypothetical protein
MNCPFYGRSLFPNFNPERGTEPPAFYLISTNGNQCAAITGSISPCRMELKHQDPDWQTCLFLATNVRTRLIPS